MYMVLELIIGVIFLYVSVKLLMVVVAIFLN
jgi:hypothetical protein